MHRIKIGVPGNLVAWWLFVALLLPSVFFAETIILLSQTLRNASTWLLPLYWVLFCGVGILLIGLALTRLNPTLGKLGLIGACVFSLFFLKLEYIESFVALPESLRIASAIFLCGVGWLFVFKLNIVRRPPAILLVASSVAAFVFVPVVTSIDFLASEDPDGFSGRSLAHCFSEYVDRWPDLQQAFASMEPAPNKADWGQSHFRSFGQSEGRSLSPGCFEIWLVSDIQFKQKPNIYILMFDAMIPNEIANIFFGEESAGYGNILKENFYIPEGVTLQERVPTRNSIRQVMWLDMVNSPSAPWWGGERSSYTAFPGRANSPLVQLFRSNGYFITTGYSSEYWGKPGRYVDQWLTVDPALGGSMLCQARDAKWYDKLVGFGACYFLGHISELRQLADVLPSTPNSQISLRTERTDFPGTVLQHIDSVSSERTPHLTFVYSADFTKHVKSNFTLRSKDLKEYIESFSDRSNRLASYLQRLTQAIAERDPSSILVVAGDHGTFLFRNSKINDERVDYVDQHGVAIGVFRSESNCANSVGNEGFTPNENRYHTVPTVILSLVACLSGNNEIFDRLPLRPEIRQKKAGVSMEQFLQNNLIPSAIDALRSSR